MSKPLKSTPATGSSSLDSKGRCCGRKPIVYKRNHYLFCDRCDRAFDLATKQQVENWAWGRVGITANEWHRKGSTLDTMTPANAAAYHGGEDDGL